MFVEVAAVSKGRFCCCCGCVVAVGRREEVKEEVDVHVGREVRCKLSSPGIHLHVTC